MMGSLTDEWVQFMSDPKNQTGLMWVLAGQYMLPENVDRNDSRVMELCRKAEAHYRKQLSEREAERIGTSD